MRRLVFSLFALTLLAFPAYAQNNQPPCDPEKNHQFDFWLGDWEVTNPQGQVVGTNHIVPILDGCAIQENWLSATGGAGTSLNHFDPQSGKWYQYWIYRQGFPLYLTGNLIGKEMILEGETTGQNGAMVLNRVTWTPNDDGSVRQHWQTSTDDGATWTTAFDGLYRKK